MFVEQTEEVEVALAAQDFATARKEARDLERRVTAAIDAGRVPQGLRRELRQAVGHLVQLIPAAEAPPATDEGGEEHEEDDKDEGKQKDDDGGKGKGHDGDEDAGATTTVDAETTTVTIGVDG